MLQIKVETANIWEYKVGNNDNIANFVRLGKPELTLKHNDNFHALNLMEFI